MKHRAWGRIAIIVAIACVLLIAGMSALGAVGRSSGNLPSRLARDRVGAAEVAGFPSNNPYADSSASAQGAAHKTNHPEGAGS